MEIHIEKFEDEDYQATLYLDGEYSSTKCAAGRSRYEAIGKLVLLYKHCFQVEEIKGL